MIKQALQNAARSLTKTDANVTKHRHGFKPPVTEVALLLDNRLQEVNYIGYQRVTMLPADWKETGPGCYTNAVRVAFARNNSTVNFPVRWTVLLAQDEHGKVVNGVLVPTPILLRPNESIQFSLGALMLDMHAVYQEWLQTQT